MNNTIRLFIENKEVELDESVHFSLNKQFEDLSNPTTIINDWSKTVSIPFSENNNKLFGHIYNPDKINVKSVGTNLLLNAVRVISNTGKSLRWYNDSKTVAYEDYCNSVEFNFINSSWSYTSKVPYSYKGSFEYEFVYNPETMVYMEFSFRSITNEELAFIQWDLQNHNFTAGEKYKINFKLDKGNIPTTVSDIILSKQINVANINFDPTKKLLFRLEWNNNLMMQGYAKMNSITKVGHKGTYNITLNGELGRLFQIMKKITFDKNDPNPEYIIESSKYVNTTMSVDTVKKTWDKTTHPLDISQVSGFEDIIGFAPNNSFNENFDYKSKSSGVKIRDVKEYIKEFGANEIEGIYNNGVAPREMGEFRSYLQIPYIWFNKLFQIFQEKFESLTDYKFDLDEGWFNSDNVLYNNLVYILDLLSSNTNRTNTFNNKYSVYFPFSFGRWSSTTTAEYTTVQSSPLSFNKNYSTEEIEIIDFDNNILNVSQIDVAKPLQNKQLCLRIQVPRNYKSGTEYTVYLNNHNYLKCKISLINSKTGQYISSEEISMCGEDCDVPIPLADTELNPTIKVPSEGVIEGAYRVWSFPFNLTLPCVSSYDNCYYNVECSWANNNTIFYSDGEDWLGTGTITTTLDSTSELSLNVTRGAGRSYSRFTLGDLWNNSYNIFDEILKYCKMYGILIFTDDINKKIRFVQRDNYFKDYNVIDWTNKIDMSKDYTITPITWDSHFVTFNYKDSDTAISKVYKEKFGANYGEIKLVTDYNFDTNNKELFKDIKQSIIYTPQVLLFDEVLRLGSVYYKILAGELYVHTSDSDDKYKSQFGSFYICKDYCGIETDNVIISDDDRLQIITDIYTYGVVSESRRIVSSYPKLYTSGEFSCLFNKPSEIYTVVAQGNELTKYIYPRYWKRYLDERYNIQNKKLTCYIHLKPNDYYNFNFNNFVRIGNQMYFVNKIYDYDVTSAESTKIDLLTVQNIGDYYNEHYLRLDKDSLTLTRISSQTVRIETDYSWTAELSNTFDGRLTLNKDKGYGDDTITISSSILDQNKTTKLIVTSDGLTQEVNVILSDGQPPRLILSNEYISHPADGTQYIDSITINSNYDWTTSRDSRVVLSPSEGFAGITSINVTSLSNTSGPVKVIFNNGAITNTLTVDFTIPFDVTTNIRFSESTGIGSRIPVNFDTISSAEWEFSFASNESKPSNDLFKWNPSAGTGGNITYIETIAQLSGYGGQDIPFYVRIYKDKVLVDVKEYKIHILS